MCTKAMETNHLGVTNIIALICLIMFLSLASAEVSAAESANEPYSFWDGSSIEEPLIIGKMYEVCSADQLAWIAQQNNSGAVDFSDSVVFLRTSVDLNNKEWTPIGSKEYPFKGNFYGCGYTIRNMKISISEEFWDASYTLPANAHGLFGFVEAENRHILFAYVNLEKVKITAGGPGGCLRPVGGLIGNLKVTNCDSVRIENVFVTGNIQSGNSTFGLSPAGGVVGRIDANNCETISINNIAMYANIHVISDFEISGGVVGQFVNDVQDSDLFVSRCYVDSRSYASKAKWYNNDCIYQGGLIGDYQGRVLSINESSVQGVIEHAVGGYGFAADHSVENVGGIVGRACFTKVKIENCYVSCDITSACLGGIIGLATCNGSTMESVIRNCCVRVRESYSTTYGTSIHRFGILFAANAISQSLPVVNCYYDIDRLASHYATAYDYHYSGGSWAPYNHQEMPLSQLTSAKMKDMNYFNDWDFYGIWKMGDSSPILRAFGDESEERIRISDSAIIQAVHRYTTAKEMDQVTQILRANYPDDVKNQMLNEAFTGLGYIDIREGVQYLIDSKKERNDYAFLMIDETYLGYNYAESVGFVKETTLNLAGLVLNGEIAEYLDFGNLGTMEYPGVKKYRNMLEDYVGESMDMQSMISTMKDVSRFIGVFNTNGIVDRIISDVETFWKKNSSINGLEKFLEKEYDKLKMPDFVDQNGFVRNVIALEKTSALSKTISSITGELNTAYSVADVAFDDLTSIMDIDRTLDVYDKYSAFLNEVRLNKELPRDMRIAAYLIQKEHENRYIVSNMDVFLGLADCVLKAGNAPINTDMLSWIINAKTATFIGPVVQSALKSAKGVLNVIEVTRKIINHLADTTDITERSQHLMGYYRLIPIYKQKLIDKANEFRIAYNTNPNGAETEKIAWEFYEIYELVRKMRFSAETSYLEMIDIDGFFGDLINNAQQFGRKRLEIEKTLSTLSDAEFCINPKHYVYNPNSKYYESKTVISCPVSVSVYNTEGRLIVTLRDGKETDIENEYGRFLCLYRPYTDDYVKVLYFKTRDSYRIIATAEEACQVSFENLNRNGNSVYAFYNFITDEKDEIEILTNASGDRPAASIYDYNEQTRMPIDIVAISADIDNVVSVRSVEISNEIELNSGESVVLDSVIIPSNSTYQQIRWISDNENLVTVKNGKVTAAEKGSGTARITAITVDGSHTSTCEVKVNEYNKILPVIHSPADNQIINVEVDNTANLSIVVDNAVSCQWFIDRNDGKGFIEIPGATNAVYTTSSVREENDGYCYFCRVSNKDGCVDSPHFTLRVIRLANLPNTGDPSHVVIWMMVAILSIIAITRLAFKRKK